MDLFRNLDAEVLAVSADPVNANLKLARSKRLDLLLLSDGEFQAIDAYGLRHPKGGMYGDVARPATFVLDRDGRIRWRELTDNLRVRVRPEPVLEQLRLIP
jgi:peroxiredoxin